MFMKHSDIAPAHMADILRAAEAATRAIPPAFPLDATVAVNPFLGQTGTDLARAAARLDRAAGVRLTLARADYASAIAEGRITDADLKAALDASTAKGSGFCPGSREMGLARCSGSGATAMR